MPLSLKLSKKLNVLNLFLGIVLILYPLVVYFGLQYTGIEFIAPVLIVLFIVRLLLLKIKSSDLSWALRLGLFLGISLSVLSWLLHKADWLLYYPVSINLLLLLVFGYSLYHPPTIVEQLARVTEPNLSLKGITYTQTVTKIWCVFFVVNATISIITCLFDNKAYWTLYNGLISYLIMGTLMGGEWLIRQKVRKDHRL